MMNKLVNQTDKKNPFENFSMAFLYFPFIFHPLPLWKQPYPPRPFMPYSELNYVIIVATIKLDLILKILKD